MNLNQIVKDSLLKYLFHESMNEINDLDNALRLLSKLRSILITNTYIENQR
ncbi:hypothetical protein EW15_1734 [Prochlorococcus sp. MIT 0801]|nr:hypothetical protein EW15_1734 [Prochlorococcus sp. MIT 0801]